MSKSLCESTILEKSGTQHGSFGGPCTGAKSGPSERRFRTGHDGVRIDQDPSQIDVGGPREPSIEQEGIFSFVLECSRGLSSTLVHDGQSELAWACARLVGGGQQQEVLGIAL